MADEIPDEVYEAATHARRTAVYGFSSGMGTTHGDRAAVDAVWPLAYAAGRASIHAQWAATLAQDPPPVDEYKTLHARAQAMAREMVEHDIRAQVAREIRTELALASCSGPCFRDRCDCRAGDVVERAAGIAEGKTPTKEGT